MKAERLNFGRFGEGLGAELVGCFLAELEDGQVEGSGGGVVLQVQGELYGLRLAGDGGGRGVGSLELG